MAFIAQSTSFPVFGTSVVKPQVWKQTFLPNLLHQKVSL